MFLDEVEAELDRLIQENEELRAKLAEVLRGGKMNPPLTSPHMDGPELMQPSPSPIGATNWNAAICGFRPARRCSRSSPLNRNRPCRR